MFEIEERTKRLLALVLFGAFWFFVGVLSGVVGSHLIKG
jgi:hypothetical protein